MAAKKAKNRATAKGPRRNIENPPLPPATKGKLNSQTTAINSTPVQPSPHVHRLSDARLQTRGCWLLLSLSESCGEAGTALEHAGKADYSLYRGEDYYSYRGEEVEEMKENCLIIDGGNHNCLRLVFAEIPKVY